MKPVSISLFLLLAVCSSIFGDSCPGAVNTNDGRCYIFSSATASWTDAKAACASQGMELAYPRNAFENAFIYTIIPDQLTNHPWLGVWSDAAGNWYDLLNKTIHYYYWDAGQPNLASSCAEMKYGGVWTAVDCSQKTYYICRTI